MYWIDGEWGSTTVEVVVVLPAFMLAVLLAVQVGMVVYAAQTAEAAAQEAVEAARGEPDLDATGVARARTVLDATGAVTNPQIHTSRGLDAVTVRVSGVAPQVVPASACGSPRPPRGRSNASSPNPTAHDHPTHV